ncbi:undecaprenyl/decaprenyl-phosphate alpha-N-acetylglucosaminyl 1-phosphate transferase [Bacillus sp. PAMC26568]|nr:undecaprenyl/decaprenyl-phosphate alpha-N-acetylglucosaminyl 1-phosphate transferase [Bacillus sp. PAMC26568]
MLFQLILGFSIAYFTSLFITPVVSKLAFKIGAVDLPNKRKVHQKQMPRLGGLSIFLGLLISLLYLKFPFLDYWPIFLSLIIILLLGIMDDIYSLGALVKLIVQLIAAIIVILGQLSVDFIYIPFIGTVDLQLSVIPITVIWILGITNSINLIDGLDGLAAGISSIVLLFFIIIASLNAQTAILYLCVMLIGGILGFLYHNFNPAKIFLGDTGSLMLGFLISVISLLGFYKTVTISSLFVPVIILGLPLFDTLLAIVRRMRNHQPVMAPDKDHMHHRLLKMGLSHRSSVLVMYLISIIFGIIGFIFSKTVLWGTITLVVFLVLIVKVINASALVTFNTLFKRH